MKEFVLIFILLSGSLYGQSENSVVPPRGFRGINLGMSVDGVKSKLLEDPYFDYRGEPDVSFLPSASQKLIQVAGFSYIDKAYFQFYEEKLYIITLVFNPDKMDYYTMFTTLLAKYGDFTILDPKSVLWQWDTIALSLEKPLSVKYIDQMVFNALRQEGQAATDLESAAREKFLEEF